MPSTTGDPCHLNIRGLSRSRARTIFKASTMHDFTIGTSDGERPLKEEDMVGSGP